MQAAQKVRPARPQGARRLKRTLWGTLQGDERLRTTLASFFSSLSSFGFAVV